MKGTEKQLSWANRIRDNIMSLMACKYYPRISKEFQKAFETMMGDLASKDADYWIDTCGFKAADESDIDEHTACTLSIMRRYSKGG